MRLRQLIKILKDENLDKVLKLGFCNPHSYRGYYEQLAFEPSQNVRVGDMLDAALDACGKTFTGSYIACDLCSIHCINFCKPIKAYSIKQEKYEKT